MTPSADGANTITFKADTKDEGSGVATLPLCQRLPASATAAIAFVSTPARVCVRVLCPYGTPATFFVSTPAYASASVSVLYGSEEEEEEEEEVGSQ